MDLKILFWISKFLVLSKIVCFLFFSPSRLIAPSTTSRRLVSAINLHTDYDHKSIKSKAGPKHQLSSSSNPATSQGHRTRTPRRNYVLILDTKISHCVGQFLWKLSSKSHHETLKILFLSLECQTSGLPHFRVINWAAGWFSPSTLWSVLKARAGIFSPLAVFHLAHLLGSSRNVSTKVTTTTQQYFFLLSRMPVWQMWFKGTL